MLNAFDFSTTKISFYNRAPSRINKFSNAPSRRPNSVLQEYLIPTLKQNNNLRLGLFNFGMRNKPAPELTALSCNARGAYGARPCASIPITKYCRHHWFLWAIERTHRWELYRWRYRHPRQPGATSVNAYNISRWDSLHTYLNLGDLARPIRQGDAFAKEKLQQINHGQGKKAERSPWESYSG